MTEISLPARLPSFWSFIRHEILFVLWALMEVAIIAPTILILLPWGRYWPPQQVTILLLLLMFIPFNISRIMSMLKMPVRRQQIVMALSLLLTFFIIARILLANSQSVLDIGWVGEFANYLGRPANPYTPRIVSVFFLVSFMWWRGISLVGRRIDINELGFRFRFGILIIAIFVAGLAGSLLDWSVTPFIFLFFFASSAALIITRVQQLELSRSGLSFPMGPRWITIVFASSLIVVFVMATFTSLASGQPFEIIMSWLQPFWVATGFLATATVTTLAYLTSPILILLTWLIGRLTESFGPSLGEAVDNLQIADQVPFFTESSEELTTISPPSLSIGRQFLIIGVMIIVILLVTITLRQVFKLIRRIDNKESTTNLPEVNLDIISGKSIGRRFLDRFDLLKRWRMAHSIRRLYQAMCAEAGKNGYPRSNTETPIEYLATLEKVWPENTIETQMITNAFIRVRYGELPESQKELEEIQSAWKILGQAKIEVTITRKDEIDIQRSSF